MSEEVIRIEYQDRVYRLVPDGYRTQHLMTANPADVGKFMEELGRDVIIENSRVYVAMKMLLEREKPEEFTIG